MASPKKSPCGHDKFDNRKQWCPVKDCSFHVKPKQCVMIDEQGGRCGNFVGLNYNKSERNLMCYFCHKFCRDNHVCITPGCNKPTFEKKDGSGFWLLCPDCGKPTDGKSSSGKSWSDWEEADALTHCIFCNADSIEENRVPACKSCQDTIKKNDPENWFNYMWKGTCVGHKHPQFGNTVCCTVCGENQKNQYRKQCGQCNRWLSSDGDCSACKGKESLAAKEFVKVVHKKAPKVERLITATQPVQQGTTFVAILKRDPTPESDEDESKGSNPPPSPVANVAPVQVPAPAPAPVIVPVPAPVQSDKVKVTFKTTQQGTIIFVSAFKKVAFYHMHTSDYEANQENDVYTISFREYGRDMVNTLRIITDQVAKTISFTF